MLSSGVVTFATETLPHLSSEELFDCVTNQLQAEQAVLDALKPGEDLVALQHAFDAADENKD